MWNYPSKKIQTKNSINYKCYFFKTAKMHCNIDILARKGNNLYEYKKLFIQNMFIIQSSNKKKKYAIHSNIGDLQAAKTLFSA